jgi:tetratricopeptide (TPR) repeat protein
LSVEQRLQLAQLQDKSGDWGECRNQLLSLVAVPNAPPSMLALLIDRLIAHDELSAAKSWLVKLRSAAPEAPGTLALEAKLAMAEKDRPTAVAAAKKLMPSSAVPLEQVSQLQEVAKLMEDLGFPKAADKALAEFADRSPEGVLTRAEFLGRQKRFDEALDILESDWSRLPLERVLQSGLTIIRGQGQAPAAEWTDRLERWFAKAKREDSDSLTVALLESELRELQGRSSEVESIYRGMLARKGLSAVQTAIVSNNLAYVLARPETSEEAKKLIDAAIEELGPQPDLLDTRGVVLLAAGDNRRAIENLEQAILVPSPTRYLHLAAAQLADKQTAAARRSLDQAKKLGLDPQTLLPADRRLLDSLEAALASTAGA